MRMDRRTDMTKLIAAFRYFAKAPKQDVKKTGNVAILYQKLPPVWYRLNRQWQRYSRRNADERCVEQWSITNSKRLCVHCAHLLPHTRDQSLHNCHCWAGLNTQQTEISIGLSVKLKTDHFTNLFRSFVALSPATAEMTFRSKVRSSLTIQTK